MSAAGVRLAWILPAFPRDGRDPLVPYWGPMARAVAQACDLDVVPLRFPSGLPTFDCGRARVHPLPHGHLRLRHSPRLWRSALERLRQLHQVRPFQLIHALHGNEAGFLGALASRMLGVPLLLHLGGGETVGFPDLRYGAQALAIERWQVRSALRRARRITVGSRFQARAAERLLPARAAGRVVQAPIGIDLAPFAPAVRPPGAARPEPRLICVAELNAVKDHPTLLQAAAPWLQALPDLRLELVGGGPRLAFLRGLARDLEISDQVVWRGQIPNAALPPILAEASGLVHGARHEAQGLALIEAASVGLPIAATRVGVAEELSAESTATAPPGDVAGLSRAIGRTLDRSLCPNPARRAAQVAAASRFDLPQAIGAWLDLYDRFAPRAKPGT